MPRQELKGQVFGRLRVVAFESSQPSGRVLWRCVCNCGRFAIVSTLNLTSGKTKSCGCLRGKNFKDETGNRYGRLLVLKNKPNPKARSIWVCKCDCGKITEVGGGTLRSGHTVSCGCYNREQVNASVTHHGWSRVSGRHPLYRIWARMRHRCNYPGAFRWKHY